MLDPIIGGASGLVGQRKPRTWKDAFLVMSPIRPADYATKLSGSIAGDCRQQLLGRKRSGLPSGRGGGSTFREAREGAAVSSIARALCRNPKPHRLLPMSP